MQTNSTLWILRNCIEGACGEFLMKLKLKFCQPKLTIVSLSAKQ